MSLTEPDRIHTRRELLGALGVCATAGLLPQVAASDRSPLEKAFDGLAAKNGFTDKTPGIAVLVRRSGKVLLQRCVGLAHLNTETLVTSKTLFYLASVSKSFTATAILLLHDRGKLSILDDVRKYIPELPVYDKSVPIRLTDLLQHVSGLRSYMSLPKIPAKNDGYWVNEDYIAEFARGANHYPLLYPTGQKYFYSNTNYVILAVVIARLTGKSFGAFLADEIFKPLGMTSSFVFENPNSIPKNLKDTVRAVGYNKVPAKWTPSWGTPPDRHETILAVGDGGIWTSLEDMAAWDEAIRTYKLIKPLTMYMSLVPSETTDGKVNLYGRGWSLYMNEKTSNMIGYGHNGLWNGFQNSYYRYLLADRTSIILSNRGDFKPDQFWYPLNDLIDEYDRNPKLNETVPGK